MKRRCLMEPMVLLGLIVVVYGGYVAWLDLRKDVSALLPIRTKREGRARVREGYLQSPIKKVARVYV